MDIKERFNQAVERLYKINYYLAGEVTKLGYPKITKYPPTAGVGWDSTKNLSWYY